MGVNTSDKPLTLILLHCFKPLDMTSQAYFAALLSSMHSVKRLRVCRNGMLIHHMVTHKHFFFQVTFFRSPPVPIDILKCSDALRVRCHTNTFSFENVYFLMRCGLPFTLK